MHLQYWNGRGHLQRERSVRLWPNMAGGRNLHVALGTRRWLLVIPSLRRSAR